MKLRKLMKKDAPYMLEWMHDSAVTKYLAKDFAGMRLENCQEFINAAQEQSENVHYAVIDDNDEYMGTVSLKNIDNDSNEAEFAITMRSSAQGKGFARYAMREIIRIALEDMKLELVYWDVSKNNIHAVHFYDKMGGLRFQDDKRAYYLSKMSIDEKNQSDYICYYTDKCLN